MSKTVLLFFRGILDVPLCSIKDPFENHVYCWSRESEQTLHGRRSEWRVKELCPFFFSFLFRNNRSHQWIMKLRTCHRHRKCNPFEYYLNDSFGHIRSRVLQTCVCFFFVLLWLFLCMIFSVPTVTTFVEEQLLLFASFESFSRSSFCKKAKEKKV
jgi:hypothetical protein